MFSELYQTFAHLPWIGWLPAALLLPLLLHKLPFVRAYLILAVCITFLDAMLGGAWYHLGGGDHALYGPITLTFVVLGDLRYFLLMYRYQLSGLPATSWGTPGMWSRALAWSFAPLLISALLRALFPAAMANMRVSYLLYELVMLASITIFALVLLPVWARQQDEATVRWLRGVTCVELAHYSLWALSDVLILAGFDLGYALRFVPDVIYYACFIPAVYLLAPAHMRRSV